MSPRGGADIASFDGSGLNAPRTNSNLLLGDEDKQSIKRVVVFGSGAMETLYQRMKIQEESLYYESRKQGGDVAIIGVNTFVREDAEPHAAAARLVRASEEEKRVRDCSLGQITPGAL